MICVRPIRRPYRRNQSRTDTCIHQDEPGWREPQIRLGSALGSSGFYAHMFPFLTITLIAVTLTGCCCLHDARGPSNICEVHHTTMRSTTEPAWGGCMLPTFPYAEARSKLFPNAGGDYIPSPWPWKRQRVSICDECLHAKERFGNH